MKIIETAKAVLRQEIEGIKALESILDENFSALVEKIAAITSNKGRVILSGMGKSGHIAHKISATLASTGTPAFFVHPAEASHGDLGMITPHDIVILLSNSGETVELKDIIEYSKRNGIFIAGIVRRKTSMLVESADIALVLPETPEASPIGVPTTSTTMMLALGDAIAIALLEKRGFSVSEYKDLHPGGKLGSNLRLVKDLMHKGDGIPKVLEDMEMSHVIVEMTKKSLGCAAVVNASGALIGSITDGDLRRSLSPDLLRKKAREIMKANPAHIKERALAVEALKVMNEKSISVLYVVSESELVGVITRLDCDRAGVG